MIAGEGRPRPRRRAATASLDSTPAFGYKKPQSGPIV